LANNLKNERTIIDALNSIAYCIRYRTPIKDLKTSAKQSQINLEELYDKKLLFDVTKEFIRTNENVLENFKKPFNLKIFDDEKKEVFTYLHGVYMEALKFDPYDIEANFNVGCLFL